MMSVDESARERERAHRADEIAWQFLERENYDVRRALDLAAEHEEGLRFGMPADSEISANLFVEFADDPGTAIELAARVVAVLRAYRWA